MIDLARRARRVRKTEQAIRALIKYGSHKRAAEEVGIHEVTLRKWASEYLTLKGYENIAQAGYELARADLERQNATLGSPDSRSSGAAVYGRP